MAGPVNYEKLARAAQARGLFGRWRRRRAVSRLAELGTPPAVPPLCAALADTDPAIAANACTALVGLTDRGAKDAFCAAWAKSRDAELAAILVEGRHVAAQPAEVRVLSVLKSGAEPALTLTDWDGWEALAAAADDADPEIAERADRQLAKVTDQEVIGRICDRVIAYPETPLRQTAIRHGWRHSDAGQDCLLLFFTDQMEEYFDQDADCQYLAETYRQGDDALQRRIREKVRASADQRLLRVLRTGRDQVDPAQTGTATSDLEVAIDVATRNENYRALFDMIERGRFQQIMTILERLTRAKWEPEEERDRRFYEELLAHYRPLAILAQQRDSRLGKGGLEGLIAGASLADVSEADLHQRAQSGPPPSRARALLALSSRNAAGLAPLVQQALGERDWTLRRAGLLAAPHAGIGLSLEATEACLDDRVHAVGAAAVQALLVTGLTGRTPADLARIERLAERVAGNLHAQQSAKDAATRALELMLCVLRRRLAGLIDILSAEEAKPTYAPDSIQILDDKEGNASDA
jgi:hypothetical protein